MTVLIYLNFRQISYFLKYFLVEIFVINVYKFQGIEGPFFHSMLLSVHLKGPSTLSAHKKTKQSVDTELIVSQTYSPQESVASFKFEFVSQNALL